MAAKATTKLRGGIHIYPTSFDHASICEHLLCNHRAPAGHRGVDMANNRYLEIIKRLLTAETYFRWREEGKEREQDRPHPEEESK
jgi:hypothetical protein